MDTETTAKEIAALRAELERLNSHRFVTIHNSLPRLLWFQFLKGLALGLGTVLGASILVSAIALVLAQFEWVPLIGAWAAEIARQMEALN
ncbi:MAG: DUF5665 domain-containing protein [Silicimonas sp.]|nr:DUF5665 domain-containing protein [Silicimonas sp.]